MIPTHHHTELQQFHLGKNIQQTEIQKRRKNVLLEESTAFYKYENVLQGVGADTLRNSNTRVYI